MTDKNELKHYGVLGMKWGVRRPVGSDGRVVKRARGTKKQQQERAKRVDADSRRRTISDEDVQKWISRLENEKKLHNLMKEDLNPGRTAAENILKSSGTKVAGAVVAGSLMYTIRGVITKNWGLGELASNIGKLKK